MSSLAGSILSDVDQKEFRVDKIGRTFRKKRSRQVVGIIVRQGIKEDVFDILFRCEKWRSRAGKELGREQQWTATALGM